MSDLDAILKLDEEDKDPNKHYSWVLDEKKHGQSTSMQMIVAKAKGYRPVLVSDVDGKKFAMNGLREGPDGLVRVGDTILMACSREKYEEREKERRLRSNPHRVIAQKKEEFEEEAANQGIPTLKVSQ